MLRKKMNRNAYCLYRRLLKKNGKIANLRDILQLYEDLASVRKRLKDPMLMPKGYSGYIPPPLVMPHYLRWIKGYMK
jgi:hypothetical protein